jgi:hypothetical protein
MPNKYSSIHAVAPGRSHTLMKLHVESRAGPYGDMEPLAFMLGGSRIEVLQVTDRWISEDYSYFKIEASDLGMYILRYTPPSREWELTLFHARGTRSFH